MYIKMNTISLILLWFVRFTISARILFLSTTPSLSHNLFYGPIIKQLSIRGHDVVSVSPDPMNDPTLTNLTEIDIHEETYGSVSITKWLEESQTEPDTPMGNVRKIIPQFITLSDRILSSTQIKKLIKDPKEHFDLLIVEKLSLTHFLAFKERCNCPAIGIASVDTLLNGMDAIGNPPHPNYYASFLHKGGPNLNFWQRLRLLWHNIDYRIFYYIELVPKLNEQMKKHFNIKTKDVVELEKSIDLIITNTNPIFHIPRPHVPNYIEIGGLHERERKPLPHDLKTFLDNSTIGAVYISLGSNIKSQNMPSKIIKSILKAFEQLPYNVIWKWENSTLPDKPKNVLIKPWLPQQDILDHPNLKAFITQGGLQSLEEAIRSVVPMVGIPFGTDQEFNVNRIANLGIGRELQYSAITTELLVESITDVATNPYYKNNIKKVANLLWDQPTKPLDRAVWWIEYVIRHQGAKHLRCPAADLPWYKYLLLDILGLILVVLILLIILIIYLFKTIFKYINSGKLKYKKE